MKQDKANATDTTRWQTAVLPSNQRPTRVLHWEGRHIGPSNRQVCSRMVPGPDTEPLPVNPEVTLDDTVQTAHKEK